MGGINTSAVTCSAFESAADIDAEFENYIVNGLIPEAEVMIFYSWWWWAMYVWNLNTQSFFTTMGALLNCAKVNDMTDGKYANQDFIDGTWKDAVETMGAVFQNLDDWWVPYMVIGFQVPWPPLFLVFTWAGTVGYLIANIITMFSNQATALEVYAALLGPAEEVEEE